MCEFGKENNCVSNVGTACDKGIKEFTKESAIGEAVFGLKSSGFFGIFRGTSGGEEVFETIRGQGFIGFGRLVGLFPCIGVP